MHITVYCPRCNQQVRVEYHLRGKNIRCPNRLCRAAFSAMEGTAPAEAEHPDVVNTADSPVYQLQSDELVNPAPSTGKVGDLVPIVEAEAVEEEYLPVAEPVREHLSHNVPVLAAEIVEPPPTTDVASWRQPPPVRNPDAPRLDTPRPEKPKAKPPKKPPDAPSEQPPESQTSIQEKEAPIELAPGDWEAPPIRAETGASSSEAEEHFASPHDPEPAPVTGRLGKFIVVAMGVAVAGLVVGMGFLAFTKLWESEKTLREHAEREYAAGRYAIAATKYQNLIKSYSSSDKLPAYQFLAEFSDVRDMVQGIGGDPLVAQERLAQLLDAHRASPLLKPYQADVWATLLKLGEQLTSEADAKHDDKQLALAEWSVDRSREFEPADPKAAKLMAVAHSRIEQARSNLAKWRERQSVLDAGERLLASGLDAEKVTGWRHEVRQKGYDKDASVQELVLKLEDALKRLVRYVEDRLVLPQSGDSVIEPSLQVVPLVGGPDAQPIANEKVVAFVARGVLYAHSQSNGQVMWSMRVGIDTTNLPVSLPRTPTSEAIFLVVSADTNLLLALEATSGRELWRFPLGAPCLGRPLVIGRRAYVPTYDGKVHEIEVVEGTRLGYFDLGRQPLTVGGAAQAGTDLLYFPADSLKVFVLDRVKKECVGILHSDHPSGSLRSAPLVLDHTDPAARDATIGTTGFLVLPQTDGLDAMKLRVFALPIERSDAAPILRPEPVVPGWAWFQPYSDPEKLALVTDTGDWAIYGINQVRNQDRPLFEMHRSVLRGMDRSHRERAQVVHAVENDFWILARGELRCLHFNRYGMSDKDQTRALWDKTLQLGSPLHASQLDETGRVLFVLTQSQTPRAIRATAVDAESGKILWQRQLGVDSLGDPVALGPDAIVLDRSGGLYCFESGKHPPQRVPWQKGGRKIADPLPDGPVPPRLVVGNGGNVVYELAYAATGNHLTIRQYQAGREEAAPATVHEIPAAPSGTPALGPDSLLLPLANGRLFRLQLSTGSVLPSPDWRAPRADDDAVGHVTHIANNDYLVTNGLRGLRLMHFTPDAWQFEAERELPARIVAGSVVVPSAEKHDVRVCVALSDETLTLLEGRDLKPAHVWKMGGKITGGPVQRAARILCVLDRRTLVCVDPDSLDEAWRYRMPGEEIVGMPQLAGEFLVAADVSGQFVGLDLKSGRPLGKPYRLRAGAAPASTPAPFGPGQALVPLTDGTVFLLPLEQLRDPPPLVW